MSAWARAGAGGLLIAVLCLLASGPADAQQRKTPLQQAIVLFHQGEWEQAIDTLGQLLNIGRLSEEERSLARKYIGVGHILLGQEKKAVEVFKAIVREDPGFDMDALALGDEEPPVEAVRYFGQAVLEVRQEEIRAREARLRQTSRRGALLRSAVFPGWGQRYLGYRGRGFMMLGLMAVSSTYVVITERAYRKAREDYETGVFDFSTRYSAYTTRADRADLALGLLGAVWLLNIIDAAVQGPNITAPASSGIAVRQEAAGKGLRVMLWKRF